MKKLLMVAAGMVLLWIIFRGPSKSQLADLSRQFPDSDIIFDESEVDVIKGYR